MLRTLGELELADGRPEQAVTLLEASMRRWAAMSLPLWRARCQRDLAEAFHALDRPDDADRSWAEAVAVFRRCDSREAREEQRAVAPSR